MVPLRRAVAVFQVLIMLLCSIGALTAGDARTDPTYLNGDQVTVKVFPTGSFVINPLDFPSRFYDTSSSFWSFKVDGEVMDTYTPLTIDNVVTPVRTTPDGAVNVQFIVAGDVLVDITYQEAGPAAEIMVTFMNLDQTSHEVGLRHLYDLKDKVLSAPGEPPAAYERAYSPPTFSKVDIFEQGQKAGTLTFGTNYMATQPGRLIFGQYSSTRDSKWDYVVNGSKELGDAPSILLYWEGLHLPAGGSVRVRHFFGADTPDFMEHVDDLSIESVSVDPVETFIGKTRTVFAIARNAGTRTRDVDINIIITDEKGYYISNGTVTRTLPPGTTSEVSWSYKVKKVAESRAIAVIEPHLDPSSGDNVGQAVIVAKPSPYKVRLEFEEGTRIQYIGINSGQKAKAVVTVENQGSVEDTIAMSVSSMPAAWFPSFNMTEIPLQPGQRVKVEVSINTVKDNDYYNYGVDVIGRSKGGDVQDKVLMFISFDDIIAKGGGNTSIGGNVTPVHKDPTNNTNPPYIPDPDDGDSVIRIDRMQVVVGVIVFMAVIIGAVAAYQIFMLGSKMSMKSILEDLYKKLYKSDTSDAYRKAIYKAYEQMCKEMEKYGHERAQHLTPKEFEIQIREYLPIDKKNLHVLTKLFEEARYSAHAFNENKKKRALKALKGIIASLEDITTFEEVPEKKGWLRSGSRKNT